MEPYRKAIQLSEETASERQYRKDAGFEEVEAQMPSILSRRGESSFVDNITSYLGKNNPFTHAVDPVKDTAWLLDNTAYLEEGKWKLEVTAAYFVKGSGKTESKAVAKLADIIGLADDSDERKIVRKRMQPLLDTVLPAHTIKINLGGKAVHRLGPSDRDGISNDILTVGGDFKDGETMTSEAVDADATPMTTTFAKAKGWAVISDIDDTIKRTMTQSPIGILKSTFVEEPVPIPGMPELYNIIKSTLSPPFWYLSASPYNLYPFLRQFREDFYPPGTLSLREASWMNLGGFLSSLTQGVEDYKVSRMDAIHKQFPTRKFLCIGDSTQSDPEAYGDVYRKYPGWVGAIFIRKVTDIAALNTDEKIKPERFEKAFKDVPKDVWTVFTDPKDLHEKVASLGTTTAD